MAGFILLALGFLGAYLRLQQTGVERRSFIALLLCWIGVGLTLPFFGAEAFGLQVIGKAAMDQGGTEFLQQVSQVRGGPGLWLIGAGLLLVAAAAILLATAVWKAGLKLQPIRIVVALIITAGNMLVARGILGQDRAAK